jgi:2,4-diaminopentanoate dehydrogenase
MLRVVQWATGPVGRHAIAAIVDHPGLELVGCFAFSPDKVGQDAGELAGIGPVGVLATGDREEILALDADCVLYMAQGDVDPAGALDNICPLLASGKNVISTAVTPLIFPASMGPEVVKRLEEACAAGGSSFHATGIEPGWASEVLPMAISGLMRHVHTLRVQELLDYASYDNSFMLFDVMGFGHKPDSSEFFAADPSLLGSVFKAPLMLLAQALGAAIDEFTYDRQTWLAQESFDIRAGRIEAGTTAAMRFSTTAIIEGRPALTVEHITRLREDAAPGWPRGRGWKVTIDGLPSMVVEARIAVNGEDENDQGCLGTAMHAVHAIAPVCAAKPGIRTFLDLPNITGRHVMTPPRTLAGQR